LSESRRTRPPRDLLREFKNLDEEERQERLAFFELGRDDERELQALHGFAAANVDQMVGEFYAHLLRFPELEELLKSEPDRIAKLQGLQRDYFMSLTDGRLDADYFEDRLRVGNAHQRIGLRPVWYIGAFSLFLRLMLRALVRDTGDGQSILPAVEALVKHVFLDMSLAINTYIYGGFVTREVAAELERAADVAKESLRARADVDRLKDDLTSMVVHDLKNPVNGIIMMVALALRKGQDVPDGIRSYLLHVDRTCREMLRLIQNLLEISKIEEGKMPVARQAVALRSLIEEIQQEYTPVADQAGRRLICDLATILPDALGDRALIKRVLINLVVNALRHSGSREVWIRGAEHSETHEVAIGVVDHGHGIAEAEQGRIFDKFRTVRRSPSDDPGGDTGLGLPFCRLAVERMGGRISLESNSQETIFTVTLPSAPPAG
jgi:signal transduction histidine kinase